MEETKDNGVVKVTYDTMHFLGVATKSISKGLNSIFPFMKSKEPVTKENLTEEYLKKTKESVTREPISIPKEPVGKEPVSMPKEPVSKEPTSVAIKVPFLKTPEKPVIVEKKEKPDDVDYFLRGIEFESKLERVEAEVYIKDFNSKLAKTREEAMEQLKKLSRKAALEILKRLLETKKDPLQVIELLNTISDLNNDGRVEKRLFVDFLRYKNTALRLAAMRALSKYKDEESFSILSSLLKDEDAEIRRQALNLLCWTYGAKCAPQVLMLFHDIDNHVRKTAIQIAGALKLRESITALILLLNNPDRKMQKSVVESLRKITGEHFGFKITETKKKRDEAIEAWRFWWRNNQVTFISHRKSRG